ncbi:hypothetical protein H8957_008512, partial [Semnopithecus entellus]
MARPATLAAATLALCLLLAPPGLAWYKPAAGRSSYSVGRAAGLLSGFRRSPVRAALPAPQRGGTPGPSRRLPGAATAPRLRSLGRVRPGRRSEPAEVRAAARRPRDLPVQGGRLPVPALSRLPRPL